MAGFETLLGRSIPILSSEQLSAQECYSLCVAWGSCIAIPLQYPELGSQGKWLDKLKYPFLCYYQPSYLIVIWRCQLNGQVLLFKTRQCVSPRGACQFLCISGIRKRKDIFEDSLENRLSNPSLSFFHLPVE